MGILRTPIRAVGRVGLAAMFITGGADAMLAPGPRTTKAAELGVPFDPELAVRINGAAMLAAGAALALGLWPRLAAGVLAGTQILEATERGAFDNLPGAGRPIEDLDKPHDELWWVKQKLRRENLSYLPPTIALRKEAEDALAAAA